MNLREGKFISSPLVNIDFWFIHNFILEGRSFFPLISYHRISFFFIYILNFTKESTPERTFFLAVTFFHFFQKELKTGLFFDLSSALRFIIKYFYWSSSLRVRVFPLISKAMVKAIPTTHGKWTKVA